MEVIVDTNVLMDAVFDQPHNEDCWGILHLMRNKDITPVVCEELLREYIFAPSKIVIKAIEDKFANNELKNEDFQEIRDSLYNCASELLKVILSNRKDVILAERKSYCFEDPEDDKLINLAVQSNCAVIISKNVKHLKVVDEKNIKTKTKKEITIYKPYDFLNSFSLIKHFNAM